MRLFLAILMLASASTVLGQAPSRNETPNDPYANFPPIPPLSMYGEVLAFRSGVEERVSAARPGLAAAEGVIALTDSLVAAWDRYGEYMNRVHGDFPNMSRGRPYWFITTDEAADTLTDRLGKVLEQFVKAHPNEKLGPARADWELLTEKLGVPKGRLFGFQFVELARRGSILCGELKKSHAPADAAVLDDAYLRFLWDLVQFYRQLHGTWYDRHTMRVAEEDWIIHRLTTTKCKEPKWKVLFSLTAIGVDTTKNDPMSDKFMHRIVVADPDCPDTVDFIVPLPHFRLMETELNKKTEAEREEMLKRIQDEMKRPPAQPQPTRRGPEGR